MWKFIKAEWNYWLKAPMTWIFFGIVTLMVFGAVSSEYINIGGAVGSVHKNAPHVIQTYYGVMSLVCLLMTTAFMNATANRDFQHDMYQLVFTSPIRKRDYFFGKFIGAYTVALIPLLGVSVGALLGSVMPWVEPERYGPFFWNGHLLGLFGFAIPNVFIMGVLLFSLAILFRSNIVSFVGAMLMLVLYVLSSTFTRDIRKEWVANILDPFGFRPESIASKYATVSEKNLHATPIEGPFLYNRLLWIGIGLVLLLVLYSRFSFSARKVKAKKEKAGKPDKFYIPSGRVLVPDMANRFSLSTFISLTWFEIKAVVRNPTFIIITIIGLINLVTDLTNFNGGYGDAEYPVTYLVTQAIQGSFYIFIIAIITFYSGVLVWKERDAKINEIQDASAVRTGMLFSSKLIAMQVTIALVLALTIVVGIISQACYGYFRFDIGMYVKAVLVLDMLKFSYLIVLALLFHYLINNRYVAYFAFVAFIIVNSFLWSGLQIRSNMVQYASLPSEVYSDFYGYAPYSKGLMWFNIYWGLVALIISFIVFAFYTRGRENGFRYRWVQAGKGLGRNMGAISLLIVAFLACSGFVYYNTQIKNKYQNAKQQDLSSIDYEKQFKKYEHKAQPRYYRVSYNIDLHPQERMVAGTIDAWAHNVSNEPISELYLTMPVAMDSMKVTIPNSTVKLYDEKLKFRILGLQQPLMPGDSLHIVFSFRKENPGFENEVSFEQLNQNGTFFHSTDILPVIGYDRNYEMSDKNDRIKYKMRPRERMPKLDENNMVARANNYISSDADWMNVHTQISTDTDQVAIAPGSPGREWVENGRRYFTYDLDKASLNFCSFLSARYKVAKTTWNGIDIRVYYNEDHAVNVPNMLKSVQRSLQYYTTNFGPYYHKQCRIVEFPRYASFAQAFPGTMPYSESIGFITDLRDVTKDDIDFVFYVVAHEMAHQYWAHQLIGPMMQGSEMMSEGFAQYSALMVMEKEYGKDKMKKFLKYEMNDYLRGRGGELEAERPIIRTEGEQYIHYNKMSVVMYYLKEMIGEDKVNGALRSLIDSFAYKNPPYPTSLSALRALKAATPDSLQYLISDMFEHITVFSNRVMSAESKKVADGYEVTIHTSSEKFSCDSLGKETTVPVNDYIDVGVFLQPGSGHKDALGKPLVMERVKVNKKENTYTFTVKEKPYEVGIDPYNYLIDRVPDDNVKRVD
jgi:ABC-2 type transport system permease protein